MADVTDQIAHPVLIGLNYVDHGFKTGFSTFTLSKLLGQPILVYLFTYLKLY